MLQIYIITVACFLYLWIGAYYVSNFDQDKRDTFNFKKQYLLLLSSGHSHLQAILYCVLMTLFLVLWFPITLFSFILDACSFKLRKTNPSDYSALLKSYFPWMKNEY